MELENAGLLGFALFRETRSIYLHADFVACHSWPLCALPHRSTDGLDASITRGRVLLPDCGLSVVGWRVFVWQPFFYFAHADFCRGAGCGLFVGRAVLGRLECGGAAPRALRSAGDCGVPG